MKWGFKSTINWNKYQSKITTQAVNWCLDYLIEPSFQGVNRLFVLSFENFNNRIVHTKYFHSIKEINYWRRYENIRKIATGQEDDYTNDCSVGYDYLKNMRW